MKTHNSIIITLLVVLSQAVSALEADSFKFKRLDVESGLSNSEIKCIYKDETGFMWFGTPSGLNRFDGYEMITYKQDLSDELSVMSNNDIESIQQAADGRLFVKTRYGYAIYNAALERFEPNASELFKQLSGTEDFWSSPENLMYIDLGKNLWFVTWNDAIRMYDVKNDKLSVFERGGDGNLSRGIIRDVKQGKNRYWFLYENGVLECMEAQTHTVIKRDSTLHKAAQLKNKRELRMFIDSGGDIWVYGIGMHYGLAHYNVVKDTWHQYASFAQPIYRISNNVVTAVEEDDKGNIWVGTDHGGVNIIDKKTGKITVLWHDETNPQSIAQNTVKCMYKDNTGMMWLGTYKNGACYYHESIYKFNFVTEKAKIPFPDINCFFETPDKNLWIGTNGGGLLYFDRKNNRYTQYKHNPANRNSPAGDVVVSLTSDQEGRLWIGYYLAGLDCFDGKTFTHYTADPNSEEGITDNNIWTLKCDAGGNLWVGTLNGGITVLDVHTGKRLKYLDSEGSVYSIIETRSGNILVGSQGGVYRYNAATGQLDYFERDTFDSIQLTRYDISNLFEDSRGLLWIGTKNGLFVYNPYTKDTRLFVTNDGLSSDLIQSILEDADNNMWIATIRGLTCIKVSTTDDRPGYFYNLLSYDSSEGLQGELFNYNAAYSTSDSELIFGGSSGFNIFTPTSMNYNTAPPYLVITDFQIYNKSVKPGESYNGRVLLKESITQTQELKLDYYDNYFSLSFASLDYCMPQKSRYYYKLEGFNDQWLEADRNSRKVTYTNLNPGKYTLYLKAMNNDGVESLNPVVLKIHIRPPFWKTTWAWILYAILIAGGGYYLLRRFMKKSERKLAYARENMRVTQQLEMDEMRLRFFTNISHEFRTPLTLILSPLEELLKKERDPEDKESLSIMRRNAKHLLTLVNQLLDFRKLDMNAATLQKSIGDIVQFVKQQSELFVEVMARKEIDFSFHTDMKHLYMSFDAEKLSKVLVNILSNAYTFTQEEGRIRMELSRPDTETIRITIEDNGIGVPEEDIDKIFDRFYQVKNEGTSNYQGSGVGLHISREFVLLHGGEIHAELLPEGGTRFVITLPCTEETTAEIDEAEPQPNTPPKVLIVEDNKDLRTLLYVRLKHHYTVLQAADGQEGQEIALRELPDIILTDVMMPKMNGIEMSKLLKNDSRTSHIPIIILTAKTGEESKLEALQAGADDYMTKPFNQDILQAKVHNILEDRKQKRKNEMD